MKAPGQQGDETIDKAKSDTHRGATTHPGLMVVRWKWMME
jgi:hypothetical protein